MDDNDWETIQPSTSASQSDEDNTSTDTVIITTNSTNPPISPQPSLDDHHFQEQAHETPSSPSSYSSSTTSEIVESELLQQPEVENRLLKTSLGVLSSWVMRIAYGIRSRIGFWSIASVAAFVTITAARRWQRRRRLPEKNDADKLLLLLNKKDEKIKQLLLQIDRMNETISARRRVPVFRVVVDSPLVMGPRFNRIPT
ncbi:hypothetical protein QVD17_31742 [Tagetes erecta]|uniref:DUF6821 domain-containing protein n=1 Tax=Tagetes erecta TaxID=13708 RepID=A0AAD8NNU8_TARER|nr:hypothetical protein QVD17_31742 [Tagetes erecta]